MGEEPGRLSVSEFAAACGLSGTAVRRYADQGLLPPAHVDPRTGYRWYDAGQVQTGVLVRMLRELDVPLAKICAVLVLSSPADRLRSLERHWSDVERSQARARATRDHLARVLGGWEELMSSFEVRRRTIQDLPVLLRRRSGSLWDLDMLVARSLTLLRARAEREGLRVGGLPVSLYAWPEDGIAGHEEHRRVVEVALPVSGPCDAVLPGGELVSTDAEGPEAVYPAVLAAYGAVSRWARERDHHLLGPPLMVHLAADRVRVGWRLEVPT